MKPKDIGYLIGSVLGNGAAGGIFTYLQNIDALGYYCFGVGIAGGIALLFPIDIINQIFYYSWVYPKRRN